MKIQIKDIIDILLVAGLIFWIYKRIRGTVALNIFIGFCVFIAFSWIVKALDMKLLQLMLDSITSVGIIAIIVLFQPELRRFLLIIGSKYKFRNSFTFEKFMSKEGDSILSFYIDPIMRACENMSKTKTGAIIIITKEADLVDITKTGQLINASISSSLIENIFFKNSPLHDGAMIVTGNKIKAASCILPVSQNTNLPQQLGLRHRAGLGISQNTDAKVIIVSEETGGISFCERGEIHTHLDIETLKELIKK